MEGRHPFPALFNSNPKWCWSRASGSEYGHQSYRFVIEQNTCWFEPSMFQQKSESESILDICDGDGVPSNELTHSPPMVTQIFLLDKQTTQLSCPETCNWVAIDDLKTLERFETDGLKTLKVNINSLTYKSISLFGYDRLTDMKSNQKL